MPTVGYATLQVIPSFKGFAGMIVNEAGAGASDAAKKIKDELTDAGEKAGRSLGQRVSAGLDRVRSVVGGIAGDIVGLGVAAAGIGAAITANTNRAQIQAALGISPDEAAAAAKVAGTVYAQGWGDSLESVSGAVVVVKQQLKGLAGGDDLAGLTQRAQTLEQVFGIDLTEAVRTAGKMVKTGLVPDVQSAFDALTAGAQRGLDASGDLTATFDEYSLFFRQLGIDAPTALGLMSQAADAGAFNLDKVGDALKEFNLRAVDLGHADAQEAFKELGLSGTAMARDVASGGEKANAAFQKVLDRLRAVKNPAEQATLAMMLFGGPGEDLAAALYALDPASAAASQGFDQVAGASGAAVDALASGVSPVEQFKRSFEQTLGVLATEAMPVLQPILDWLQDAGPTVARVAVAFAGLVAVNKTVGAVKSVAGGIRETVTAAKAAGPAVKAVGRGIGAVGAGAGKGIAAAAKGIGSLAVQAGGAARSAALMAVNFARAGAAAAASAVRMIAVKTAQLAIRAATIAWTAVQWLLNAAMTANPLGVIIVAVGLLIAGIVLAWKHSETFRTVVLAVWGAIKTGVAAAVGFVRDLIATVWGWITTYISTAVAVWRAVISAVWAAISTVVSTAINTVRAIITTVVGWITAWWRTAINAWKLVISTVWSAIVAVVQGAIAKVKSIISGIAAVIGVIRSAFDRAKSAAVDRLGALLEFVRGIPGKITGLLSGLRDKLVKIGRNIVEGLRDGISAAWHLVTDKIDALIQKIPKKIRDFFGISSPARLMRRLFYHVGEGAALGVGDSEDLVERAAGRLASAAAVGPLPAGVVAAGGITATASAASRPSVTQNFYPAASLDEAAVAMMSARRLQAVGVG